MRAFVVGKSADMDAELFKYYLRAATGAGLRPPPPSPVETTVSTASRGTQPRGGAAFSAILLDFEMAEHFGFYSATADVFGGAPSDYLGRVVGCRVHLQRFLLAKCGNSTQSTFYQAIMEMRDSDALSTLKATTIKVRYMHAHYVQEGDRPKAGVLKWLLSNPPAVAAAFPVSAGRLGRDAVRSTGETTNAIDALNKQTQSIVAAGGDRSLLGAVSSLWDFYKETADELSATNMRGSSTSKLTPTANKVRELTRSLKRNRVPAASAPPWARPKPRQIAPSSTVPGQNGGGRAN